MRHVDCFVVPQDYVHQQYTADEDMHRAVSDPVRDRMYTAERADGVLAMFTCVCRCIPIDVWATGIQL
jgi:hypothetical protein